MDEPSGALRRRKVPERVAGCMPYNSGTSRTVFPASMALLDIQNVTRRFGDFTAVDGVSLGIEAGEFFTLLGPSGCGKTTLLRMIAGFDLPDDGRIVLDGHDLAGQPPEQRPVRTVSPQVSAYVAAYGIMEPSMRAVAKALFGRIQMTGRLPVSIPTVG